MNVERIEQYIKIFGILAGLFVAGFGVYQYYEDLQQDKINQSFDYFHRYHSGEILKIRLQFHAVTEKLLAQLEDKSEVTVKDETIEKFKETKNRLNYEVVLEFFDDVYKCVEAGGCQKETTLDLFADKAQLIWITIEPVLTHYRTLSQDHGSGLECIAMKYKSKRCYTSFQQPCSSDSRPFVEKRFPATFCPDLIGHARLNALRLSLSSCCKM